MTPMDCIQKRVFHPLLGGKELVIRYYRGVVRQNQTLIRRTVTYQNNWPVGERVDFDQEFWIGVADKEKRISPLGFVAPLREGQLVTVVTIGSRTRHFCMGVYNHATDDWTFTDKLYLFFSHLWGKWRIGPWFLMIPMPVVFAILLARLFADMDLAVGVAGIGSLISALTLVIAFFVGEKVKSHLEMLCREGLPQMPPESPKLPQDIYL